MKLGIDVGSTTLKCVLVDEQNKIRHKSYQRHFSRVAETLSATLAEICERFGGGLTVRTALSGSAGMGMAERAGVCFVQEVYATKLAVEAFQPDTDVVVELGGEDAKILFLASPPEIRMNGSCAGGTGAFIDQMASLLNVSPADLDHLSGESENVYAIASRCGVFAKSDIQPLLNQGARREDIAKSIFYAVVNQTIGGLAQGREIDGRVLYLGGPLTFLPHLRQSFDEVLGLWGSCPEDSLYYVAIGAALGGTGDAHSLDELRELFTRQAAGSSYKKLPPLFGSRGEYEGFVRRHNADVERSSDESYSGPLYIGLDAGSTTLKLAVLDQGGRLLFSRYTANGGNPVPIVKAFLAELYGRWPQARVAGSAVTGYGEEIIRNAFSADHGIVETMAHFTAARHFCPGVQFIIDIGGQDIKCFRVRDNAIDDIFLNEACSSGCGSFLQSFASVWGYSAEEFARLGLFADAPVDLGSRCTVFMNSAVKEAQKNGASVENISAGLSMSVVKNALYKVIRTTDPAQLGEQIVVQGGTFQSDAVLRAFELELGREVIRPTVAGIMGAYGAALYAMQHTSGTSTLIDGRELESFAHNVKAVRCGLCSNRCALTVNTFAGGRRFIGGNRCERPLGQNENHAGLNLYGVKRELLTGYVENTLPGTRGSIGIPLGLNLYEMLPFWHAFFTALSIEPVFSPFSTHELYLQGQSTIPSDTVCFPAKLMHGHIKHLIDAGCGTIFYPCMTYNLDEKLGDNHYNCPVVAYYPEVISANMAVVDRVRFIYDYIGIHRKRDLPKKLYAILARYYTGLTRREVERACTLAFAEYDRYLARVRDEGAKIIAEARRQGLRIIVLAGRPYHIDPEINHGIDGLIATMGAAVISEDAVSGLTAVPTVEVLNQWSYHARLYAAAAYVCTQPDMDLIQLVSFGCGIDAITTDEVRRILGQGRKVCTQLKIDEITNLGAVKIRLRSLFAATEAQSKEPLPC